MEKVKIRKNQKVMVIKGGNKGIVGKVIRVDKKNYKYCVLINVEFSVAPEDIEPCGRMY